MNRKGQKGSALVISLITLLLMSIIIMGASRNSTLELVTSNNYQFGIEAFNNAETGVVATVAELNDKELAIGGFNDLLNGQFSTTRSDPNTKIFFDTIIIDDNDGDGNTSMDSNKIVSLISQGTSSSGATRTVKAWISNDPITKDFSLDKAIMTEGDIHFGGVSELHGSNQDIHSNGDIYKGDKPKTDGLLSAVGYVYGLPDGESESYANRIEIPEIDPSVFAEYAEYVFDSVGNIRDADGFVVGVDSYRGWVFNGSQWNTAGNDILGGLLYFKGDAGNVMISSNTGTEADPWEISILADGWIALAGTPILANYKNPSNPISVQDILFMAGTDIKINGHAGQVLSGIIAAGEQFQFNGTAKIEGVIIAADQSNTDDFITENLMSGTADITYGGDMSFPGSTSDNTLRILAWEESFISRTQFANLVTVD